MKCLICGAMCKCKNARDNLCCPCHRHKVRGFKIFTYHQDMPMSREAFFTSMEKHQREAEQRLLEFQKHDWEV